jgi:hypothetical protein
MDPLTIDIGDLRGLLAKSQIDHKTYAEACQLNRIYLGRILAGSIMPGELARIRMQRGLVALGLDRQAVSA